MSDFTIRSGGARLSPCGEYRYELTRRLAGANGAKGICTFVMLNPSVADALQEDPTVRRCLGFASKWGYDRVCIVNIFALRSTDPKALKNHPDPIGPENDRVIAKAAADSNLGVVAWGTHGALNGRGKAVQEELCAIRHGDVYRLGVATKDGHPRHPLYLKGDTPLIRVTL